MRIFACDFVHLTIIHAKPSGAIFLSNQNDMARPTALAWLNDASVQHFLDLSFFHILFSGGKSSGREAYGTVVTGINSMSDQVSLSDVLRATAEYISVFINGRCKLLMYPSSDMF